jgi:hypothetical protein
VRRAQTIAAGPALGDADERGPLHVCRVHHGKRVVGVLLHRRSTVGAVRQALAALVEGNDPRKGADAIEEPLHQRLLE